MNVRSVLEYSILVILNSLTKQQMNQFEKVQKKATQILLNNYEMPYADRLKMCNLSTLQGRWEQLFVKFATDTVKSGRI